MSAPPPNFADELRAIEACATDFSANKIAEIRSLLCQVDALIDQCRNAGIEITIHRSVGVNAGFADYRFDAALYIPLIDRRAR